MIWRRSDREQMQRVSISHRVIAEPRSHVSPPAPRHYDWQREQPSTDSSHSGS